MPSPTKEQLEDPAFQQMMLDAISKPFPHEPPQYLVTVRGNCGVTHASFEEWQRCAACKGPPRPLQPWWRTAT